jgi:hypothetical protein
MRFVSYPPMERQIGLDRWRCPFFGLQLLQAIAVQEKLEWMRSAGPDRGAAEEDALS